MDTKGVVLLALPAGFFKVNKGGRPKKEARDAAVFLAKVWRMDKENGHNEKSSVAEDWIVAAWEKCGKKASEGIGEAAHVRASIKRARARGLNQSLLGIYSTGLCTAVEGERTASGGTIKDGARAWCWVEGMTEAQEARVKNLTVNHTAQGRA